MDKDRTVICNIMSELLDNPDRSGIYPTSKAYDALENYIESVRVETLGWAYADACVHLDKNEDYRKLNVPEILNRALIDLA
ncbi:MAG: hypothetical protein SVO01_12870 [Thermotogota bacterium]|nr:hypothetical protein [Thermotogota bacterium]